MSDDEFLQALESCELPAGAFGHRAHVRAAYLYLIRGSFEAALNDMRCTLQRYVAHLGQAHRYDDAMTAAYMRLIHRRIVERGDAGGWAAFVRENADLIVLRA
jgi:3-methyladenine DNA glycosylase AlkC